MTELKILEVQVKGLCEDIQLLRASYIEKQDEVTELRRERSFLIKDSQENAAKAESYYVENRKLKTKLEKLKKQLKDHKELKIERSEEPNQVESNSPKYLNIEL